jgi:6,7-dimethyl-8-ribityllumazine synthase
MAGKARRPAATSRDGEGAHILILEARFHAGIADALAEGAIAELQENGASFERVAVPGALEIPLALAQAVRAGLIPRESEQARFDGCVALGCVIRGETTHYETVCENANHWLMEVAVRHGIPLGNAILTVENEAQAIDRAQGLRDSKGADAARACLQLVALARDFAQVGP